MTSGGIFTGRRDSPLSVSTVGEGIRVMVPGVGNKARFERSISGELIHRRRSCTPLTVTWSPDGVGSETLEASGLLMSTEQPSPLGGRMSSEDAVEAVRFEAPEPDRRTRGRTAMLPTGLELGGRVGGFFRGENMVDTRRIILNERGLSVLLGGIGGGFGGSFQLNGKDGNLSDSEI